MIKEIKARQICFFFIALLPVTKLFMMPSILARTAGEDLWLSALINFLLDLITVAVMLACAKKYDTDIYGLIEGAFGKGVAKIIYFVYFAFFMLKAIVPIIEQRDFVELTLYLVMPSPFYFIPFFIVMFYLCTKKPRVFGRAADVLWAGTLTGLLLLVALSVKNADFAALLPGFANKNKIFYGSYVSSVWFKDGVYMLFFIGRFNREKHSSLKIILSFVLSAALTLFTIIIFYCAFTSIAFRQQFALTEIAKYTTVINNTGRLDYIAILLMLFSNLFALALPVFFAAKILDKIFSITKPWISPLICSLLIAVPVFLLNEFSYSIEFFTLNYLSAFFILSGNILPLFTVFIKERKSEKLKT